MIHPQAPCPTSAFLPREELIEVDALGQEPRPALEKKGLRDSPFNVILVRLVGLVGCLNIVSFAYHGHITLHIALESS